jgi:phosphoribosylformylglycinamidine cyclo-ligase
MGQYVAEDEMYRAFNMGVGMVWVVEPEDVDAVLDNTDGYVIGALVEGEKGVEMV